RAHTAMRGRENSGSLRRVSIRWRLIGLAVILLAAMAGTSLYVRGELERAEMNSGESARLAGVIEAAVGVRVAFNDLRYWQTDLAVSLLTLAERNAAEARERLAANLERLSGYYPEEGARIAEEVARFDDLSSQAVES